MERVGEKLGTLLKIDACTSATLRGRYARICVQVATDKSVKKLVTIGTHHQRIIYEGEGILCTICGRVGHTNRSCPPPQTEIVVQTGDPQQTQTITPVQTNQITKVEGKRVEKEKQEVVKFPQKSHGPNNRAAQPNNNPTHFASPTLRPKRTWARGKHNKSEKGGKAAHIKTHRPIIEA